MASVAMTTKHAGLPIYSSLEGQCTCWRPSGWTSRLPGTWSIFSLFSWAFIFSIASLYVGYNQMLLLPPLQSFHGSHSFGDMRSLIPRIHHFSFSFLVPSASALRWWIFFSLT